MRRLAIVAAAFTTLVLPATAYGWTWPVSEKCSSRSSSAEIRMRAASIAASTSQASRAPSSSPQPRAMSRSPGPWGRTGRW